MIDRAFGSRSVALAVFAVVYLGLLFVIFAPRGSFVSTPRGDTVLAHATVAHITQAPPASE